MKPQDADGTGGAALSAADVAHYYDRNTQRFLSYGGGGRHFAIHRQLWGPGVATTAEAARYINGLIGAAISEHGAAEPRSIVDFGCGVGGTLFDLARRWPQVRMTGVTISARQMTMARGLAQRLGVADRCRFELGDFESVALGLRADAVVAVEAFAHSIDAGRFFANAARHLRPGGLLVIADDFVAGDARSLSDAQCACVREFARGWQLGSLATAEVTVAGAAGAGFELLAAQDLTPLIRNDDLRHRMVAGVGPLCARLGLRRLPFFANMIGGSALQRGMRLGALAYRLLVFRLDGAAAERGPAYSSTSGRWLR